MKTNFGNLEIGTRVLDLLSESFPLLSYMELGNKERKTANAAQDAEREMFYNGLLNTLWDDWGAVRDEIPADTVRAAGTVGRTDRSNTGIFSAIA